jgi:hypothetical protein
MTLSKEDMTKEQRRAFKASRRAEKEAEKSRIEYEKLRESEPQNKDAIVTVLCVRFGNKYGKLYVEKLRNMVSRHMTVPYEFVCLTDDPTPMTGVRLIVRPNEGYAKGWWHKVHMFDPSLPLEGRILYMDLDVIVHSRIDKLATMYRTDFVGIRDFNRKFQKNLKRLNSSVMAWNHRSQTHIWEQFKQNPKLAMRMHGDQDWIWKTSHDRLKFWPDEWVQSYKWEVRSKNDLALVHGKRRFKEANHDVQPNKNCSICVFHGDPNPSDIDDAFVVENWK